jgi:hypothetical protein
MQPPLWSHFKVQTSKVLDAAFEEIAVLTRSCLGDDDDTN